MSGTVGQKPIVLFRADGDTRMGLGHLYRSAALAEMLAARFDCQLAYRHAPPEFLERFDGIFSARHELSGEKSDPRATVVLLERLSVGIVILDGYHFTEDYQRAVRRGGETGLVCIDDIHASHFVADLVINHAPVPNLMNAYRGEDRVTYALGPAYALLRAAYLRAARLRPGGLGAGREDRFLICFGGSDNLNVTSSLLRRLTKLGYGSAIDVVMGASNPHGEIIAEAARLYPGEVVMYRNLDDTAMIERYRACRVAFLPASTIMMEALAVGVPVIGGYYVENQRDIYRGFLSYGLIAGIGDWREPSQLAKTLEALSVDKPTLPSNVLDGYSDVNLRQAIQQLGSVTGSPLLLCRPAIATDCLQYFEWVNDPAVRRSAIRRGNIVWEEHEEWFTRRLLDDSTLLLHFSTGKMACGQVRFEIEGGQALVDVSIDARHRGRGFGPRMLFLAEEQLQTRHAEVDRMAALIRLDNQASLRSFQKAGYVERGRIEREGVVLHRMIKMVQS